MKQRDGRRGRGEAARFEVFFRFVLRREGIEPEGKAEKMFTLGRQPRRTTSEVFADFMSEDLNRNELKLQLRRDSPSSRRKNRNAVD